MQMTFSAHLHAGGFCFASGGFLWADLSHSHEERSPNHKKKGEHTVDSHNYLLIIRVISHAS